jgi:2-dehydro-3-deoxyphosphogluconate aldolase/(4S)-4-hydroxy-2-oxoglutarate aldolase
LSETFQRIAELGVVPVIAIGSVEAARPLADALIAGGLPIAEITFRTAAAADVMTALNESHPDLLLGAGTVLTVENLERAAACGATFAVAPGLNPAVVKRAAELGIPFCPGVATPSDIEAGLALGCKTLKFFPAGQLGGAAMVKALSGPYRHTGVKFVPTGGVNPDNLEEYLRVDTVAACGGTWLAKKEVLAAGDWDAVTQACKEAVVIVARARG